MSPKRWNLLASLVAVCLVMWPIAAALGEEQLLQLVPSPRLILLGEVQGDPFELMSVRIDGDVLVCQVSYVGGCAAHQFASSWWIGFRESDPVQADVGLVHDAGGDACRDTITETLRFDLMPMKEAYKGNDQAKHGRIAVGVRGFQTPIPKRPLNGKISNMSVSHRLGDLSPEPLHKVHGLLYEF
ncbi:MAG TPA: hypothetical protein DDX89_04475 [Candidatus Omnitrophica bacterium]|nr:MAG: hypothetical protein A2Z92_02825 [Omnitrophica WOR_2 bacterium GWA2_63_20]OGX34694.1 MAG: hypothetical protein A3B73_06150 [Omnitrophica WOR_2 bacterium RIFCSPHIGHO2_02_FULL_63_39]OGX49231.1 MAG: hypothetical protein A3G88_04440 [Omnitrophica WOR_2 bacterium RIFCSPLOWO2_12_FULL_63_16]HBH97031.1 hypothetical protein [Candidatus Omnitrophota bacterium]HBQ38316.1 hypothetical protein [Candidatus Omnitrophota bacterium]